MCILNSIDRKWDRTRKQGRSEARHRGVRVMGWFTGSYRKRTLCDVLQEMREINKKSSVWSQMRSKAVLRILIEEAQVLGNRMETALEYKNEISNLIDEIERLHAKKKQLNKKKKELKSEIGEED